MIKELQDEYNKSPRLRNKFPWVNDPEYAENRSYRLQLSKQERNEIEQAFDFMFDHKRTAYPTVSRVDVTVLAHAYVLGLPVVTDDTDMLALAKDFGIATLKTLDLLKLMLESGHIDMVKIREIVGYLCFYDRPKEFKADYKQLFKEELPG